MKRFSTGFTSTSAWKNPRETMKRRIRGSKRKVPSLCSPKRPSNEKRSSTSSQIETEAEQQSQSEITTAKRIPVDFSSINEFSYSVSKKESLKENESKEKMDFLPIDFRLGSGLRLESPNQFFWLEASKGIADYDDAIKLFCSFSSRTDKATVETMARSFSSMSRFLACTFYWQFPDIAWQSAFPRLESESRLIATRNAAAPSLRTLGDPVVKALSMHWSLSFKQLYNSWRHGKRPYYYVCCPTNTMLFWKTVKGTVEIDENAGQCDEDYDFRVVITPTTFGFRQKLRDDGVKYSMPFRHGPRRSSSLRSSILTDTAWLDVTQSQPPLLGSYEPEHIPSDGLATQGIIDFVLGDNSKENEEEREDEMENEEKSDQEKESSDDLNSSNETDNDEWLKEIGLSPTKVQDIRRSISMMSSRSLDYDRRSSMDPEVLDEKRRSAIVLNDLNSIEALYKTMTESEFGRVIIGPQAGFPPTLLAKQPFLHSVLKNLKCKYRQCMKDGVNSYICEWEDGPVMLHMLKMLETFLQQSSKPEEESPIDCQVSGRFNYPGMNDVAGLDGLANFSSFEFRFGSFFKS